MSPFAFLPSALLPFAGAAPWIAFNAAILLLLAIDTFLLRRSVRAMSYREAFIATLVWVAISLAFGAGIWLGKGREPGLQFFTGYLVEYSLSADNLFVFVLIFEYFRVPAEFQPRVLSWGVLGAMLLRGAMIGVGALLLAHFHWVLYVFGVFLLVTGCQMPFRPKAPMKIETNPVLRLCRAVLPIARAYSGPRFLVREEGRLCLTPLALVVIVVECVDLVFAVDSVPAVFAITQDPFVVYTSNICAILGLRSLYFLLARAMPQLRFLKTGLAVILAFIGGKMLLAYFYAIPNAWSLAIVAGVLVVAVLASRQRRASGTS
jgi:tellurite resistance protein TerC